MKLAAIAAAFGLSGCASLSALVAPPYVPKPIRVYDARQYAVDDSECKAAGASWVPSFDVGDAISSTVSGATSETSLIPVSPLVPVYGAAGGLAKAASDGFDVASSQHAHVYENCLHDEISTDHSAVVADPHQR